MKRIPFFLLLCVVPSFGATLLDAQADPAPVRAIQGRAAVAMNSLTLWYRSPAHIWTDALAVGNGRLGAMIFGEPETETLQLNDITVWSGGPMPNADRPDAYKALPAIREALNKGDYATATALTRANMTTTGKGDSEYWPSYETLGNLNLDFKLENGTVTNYLRWLDLETAVSGLEFNLNGVAYRRETFSSAPDHAIVSHLTADRPGKISFTLRLSRVASAKTEAVGQDTLVMKGDTTLPAQPARAAQPPPASGPGAGRRGFPAQPAREARLGDVDYEAQVRVRTVGGTVKAEGDRLVVEAANEATITVAAGTSYILDYDKGYKGADPHKAVTEQLRAASEKPYAALKAAHVADYQSYFNRVKFLLPATSAANLETDLRLKNYGDGVADPSLAVLYYQMGRYLLISSSRPDNPLPSNSQGIWGDGLDLPWKADYKSNINYQMNYWPSETANLSELHMPAIHLDASLVKPGTKTAQAYYNAPGWALAFTTNAWGWTSPGPALPYGAFFGGGGWLMDDVWEHYAFTRNREFLRTYYPLMKGSAEFYLSILVPDANGKLITAPSLSPENSYKTDQGAVGSVVDGAAVEREIIWDLFTNTIAASEILDIDPAFRERMQQAKANLRPLEIGKAGQLEEWGHDWDLNSTEMNHRHVSHLYAAFPGWEISPEMTPDLAAAVRKSLALRGDEGTGWSNAWKINLYARLHDGDHALKIVNEQLRLAAVGARTDYHGEGGGTYGNMFDAHPPFQIDGNFGSTSGIDEMLLQSSERYKPTPTAPLDHYYIDLLPALPSLWPNGSIQGLRARGGFEVDETWKDGALQAATIRNMAGDSARLRYKGQTINLKLGLGQELVVTAPGGKMQVSAPRSARKLASARGSMPAG